MAEKKVLTDTNYKNNKATEIRLPYLPSSSQLDMTNRGQLGLRAVADDTGLYWWDGSEFVAIRDYWPDYTAFVNIAFTENAHGRFYNIIDAYNAGYRNIVVYGRWVNSCEFTLPSTMTDANITCIGYVGLIMNGGTYNNCSITGKQTLIYNSTYNSSFPNRTIATETMIIRCTFDVSSISGVNLHFTGGFEYSSVIRTGFLMASKITVANDNTGYRKHLTLEASEWNNNELNIYPNGFCNLSVTRFGQLTPSPEYSRIFNQGVLHISKLNSTSTITSFQPYAGASCSEFINNTNKLTITECNLKFTFWDSATRYLISNTGTTYMSNCNVFINNSPVNTLINNLGTLALGSVISNKGVSGVAAATGSVYVSTTQFL